RPTSKQRNDQWDGEAPPSRHKVAHLDSAGASPSPDAQETTRGPQHDGRGPRILFPAAGAAFNGRSGGQYKASPGSTRTRRLTQKSLHARQIASTQEGGQRPIPANQPPPMKLL